jgi:hypothetical protein
MTNSMLTTELRATRTPYKHAIPPNQANQTNTCLLSIQSIYSRLAVCNPLPPHTIPSQDALHRVDCPFLCSLRPVFQWVTSPKYMLTALLPFFQPLHMLRQLLLKE